MKMAKGILVTSLAVFLLLVPGMSRGQQKPYLTGPEVEKLRDAQNPSVRIEVYLQFQQSRLDAMQQLRAQQPALDEGPGSEFRRLLSQYVSITDEMKDWISDQYDRHGDMRKGLRTLIEHGPGQVDGLKRLEQQSPGAAGADRRLQDAIADMSDAIDGSAKAYSAQVKLFGELKKEQKLNAKEIKQREKEQKKQLKEEEKLRKRMDKEHSKAAPQQD